jgi:ABC-2 type transport system ATP-binding protein
MITIEKVSKKFKDKKILQEVSLYIETGKIIGLIGNNGVGKSTLIKIVAGLVRPDTGFVSINGEKVSPFSYKYRKLVGYMFDKPLYSEKLKGGEFLQLVANLYELENSENIIENLMIFFDLVNDKNTLIENYSKGMQQKISLCAALIHSPQYLILDEPFNGLDNDTLNKLIFYLKEKAQNGSTILVTSHQIDILSELCSSIALLENGFLIPDLTTQDLNKYKVNFSTPTLL